jgi:GNAT superfamily N-acetyltransferase
MLTNQQLQDIEQLQKICEDHGHFQLKLNWDMLRSRQSDPLDFFHYEDGELTAFLGLYPFGSTVEVCGMVRPDKRRRGLFSQLFQQAMAVAKHNGYKTILLNAPASSASGKALLNKEGAVYDHSEHQMEWQARQLEPVEGVTLRQAQAEDWDMRIRLSVEAFGDDEEDAKAMESMFNEDKNSTIFMIEVNEEAVGKIRISLEEDTQTWIYGFCILPGQQGKGIGRKTLQRVISEQHAAGRSVHLEVETKNEHALGLYEAVGFKAVHAQDYYTYPVS